MSRRTGKSELPHDAHVVQALRHELHRNTRQISQAFWLEFEQIRKQQRDQLAQERNDRERITTLMQDVNLEAQQQAEALIHTMSSHGINPSAPSPIMRKESAAAEEKKPQHQPQLQVQQKISKKSSTLANVQMPNRSPFARIPTKPLAVTKTISKTTLTPATSNLPRAPPTSRATMTSSLRTTSTMSMRNTSTMAKQQLAHKPRK